MEEGVQEKPKLLFRLLERAVHGPVLRHQGTVFRAPPQRDLILIPKAMGLAFFYARPGMRRRLAQKMADAMPGITDPRELDRLGREVCSGVFMPLFDIFILARHGDRYMRELRLEGWDILEEAGSKGQGRHLHRRARRRHRHRARGNGTPGQDLHAHRLQPQGHGHAALRRDPGVLQRHPRVRRRGAGLLRGGKDIIPKVKEHLKAGETHRSYLRHRRQRHRGVLRAAGGTGYRRGSFRL